MRTARVGLLHVMGPLVLIACTSLVSSGCATTAREEIQKGTDPRTVRTERQELLRDALSRRDPGVAQDLVARLERLVDGAIAEDATRANARPHRECCMDVLAALVEAGDRTGPPIAVRLADTASPLLIWRPALEALAKHPDPSVQGLARERLRR